jgi:hypothetical protein
MVAQCTTRALGHEAGISCRSRMFDDHARERVHSQSETDARTSMTNAVCSSPLEDLTSPRSGNKL